MKTPALAVHTALLCLLGSLGACGGGNGEPDPQPPGPVTVPAPPPPPAPAPAPAPPPPAPAAAAITPVGEPEGLAVTATIGAAGGSLASPDGSLVVLVPANAFAAPVTLSLQPISNHALGGLGRAWRIEPHAVVASQPITLRWRYDAEDAGAVAGLAVATQRADGSWVALRDSEHDAAQRTLSVQTRHFSDWSLVAGLQLRPASGLVEVGGRLALSITRCLPVDVGTSEAEIPLAACETLGSAGFGGYLWAANGVAGGDTTQGRIVSPEEFLFPGVAAYVAPATPPTGNPVAVSARYTAPPFGQGVTLVSNIRVVETRSGCAWMQDVQSLDAEVEARYVWRGLNGPWDTALDHRATLTGRLQRAQGQGHLLQFRGALASGQVQVNESRSVGSGAAAFVETESGQGAPYLGDAAAPASAAVVSVDLLRCKVWLGVEFAVASERTSAGLPSSTPTQGGAAFSIGERDIGTLRFIAGQGVLPAVGTGDFSDRYNPAGLNNSLQLEQAGTADVRWLFKPGY